MKRGDIVADRYLIEARAGANPSSRVFRVRDEGGELGALKLASAEAVRRAGGIDGVADRFDALAAVDSPAVVRYLDHGPLPDGGYYAVAQWLDGVDLHTRRVSNPLSVADVAALAQRLAGALVEIHAHGALHRAIKPSNIVFVGGDPARAVLVDFELAPSLVPALALANEPPPLADGAAPLAVRPVYVAPEQVRGELPDERSDIFSLGCVLHECLHDAPAFASRHELAACCKVLFDDTPRTGDPPAGLPPALAALIACMLAKVRDGRPQSGAELATALSRLPVPTDAPMRMSRSRPIAAVVPEDDQRTATFVVAVRSSDIASARLEPRMSPASANTGDLDEGGVPEAIDEEDEISVPFDEMADGASRAQVPARASNEPVDVDTAPMGQFSSLVMAYGAQLDLLRGGPLVALLHGAGTSASRAVSAVRCAQAMQRELAADATAVAAIATGRGQASIGDAIDRAFGLLSGVVEMTDAPGGPTVVMDEATAALAAARFESARDGLRFTLTGERPPGAGNLLMGRTAPFVGRSRELATLSATLDECLAERVARAVLVTGMSGYGKSRLRHAFVDHVRRYAADIALWTTSGHPLRPDAPLTVAADLVRRIAGVAAGEPIERIRDAIRGLPTAVNIGFDSGTVAIAGAAAVVTGAAGGDVDTRARRARMFLCELLGVPWNQGAGPERRGAGADAALEAARHDPALMSDLIGSAVGDLIEAEAGGRPVVIVIDDMQWCDRATAELFERVLRQLAERPFLVVAFGRPEIHDRFRDLWVRHGRTELSLSGLTRRAAEKLIRSVLGSDIDHRRVAALLRCAGGNTFYLEELIRSASEGRWDLPDTAIAMVHARLGALAPPARRVLRAASVFGDVFWARGVSALLGGDDVDSWLQLLGDSELIAPRATATLAGQSEYEFRDPVVRENTYAMIRHQDRRVSHGIAAAWLADAGEPDPQTIAEHFARGGEPERALAYHVRAAARALSMGGWDVAIQQADRAAACGARDEMLGEVRRIQALAHEQLGDHGEVARTSGEAMALLPRGAPGWCQVAGVQVASAIQRGDLELARATARALGEIAVRQPDGGPGAGAEHDAHPEALAIALARAVVALCGCGEVELANQLWTALTSASLGAAATASAAVVAHRELARAALARSDGDLTALRTALAHATEQLAAIGDARRACRARAELGRVRALLGDYADAEAALRAALIEARSLRLDRAEHEILTDLGATLLRRGATRDAQTRLSQAAAWHDEHRHERGAATARVWLARLSLAHGDLDTAERKARAAVAALGDEPLAPAARSERIRPLAEATLAAALLARDRRAEAVAVANAAIRGVDAQPDTCAHEIEVRLACSEVFDAAGEDARVRGAIEAAHARLQERAARLSAPTDRSSFLGAVAAHARVIELYEIQLSASRTEASDSPAAPVSPPEPQATPASPQPAPASSPEPPAAPASSPEPPAAPASSPEPQAAPASSPEPPAAPASPQPAPASSPEPAPQPPAPPSPADDPPP